MKGYFTSNEGDSSPFFLPVERQVGVPVDRLRHPVLPSAHVLPDYGGQLYDAGVRPPAHSRHLVSPVGGRDATVHHVAVDQLLEEGQASLVFDETAVLN